MFRAEPAALAATHFSENLKMFLTGDIASMCSLRSRRSLALSLFLGASAMIPLPAWSTPETRAASDVRQSWIFHEAMVSMDGLYDPAVGLLRGTVLSSSHPVSHPIRESSWYAFGLMMRHGPTDQQRAERIMNVILDNQYPASEGMKDEAAWAGSFRRSPDEPLPTEKAVAWNEYDPNWREFIGSEFALMLHVFGGRLTPDLRSRLHESIHQAVQGELHNRRLSPSYTNIAIMFGQLLDEDAVYRHDRALAAIRDRWIHDTVAIFHQHQSFMEYNSPTYYGVDLFGLGLWRRYGSTTVMRSEGEDISRHLWTDIAAFYSAPMKNLSGPYDRAYGMDMESYVALLGDWIGTFVPRSSAPLPATMTVETPHLADLWFAPTFVFLKATLPSGLRNDFLTLRQSHDVTRRIDNSRSVSARVERDILLGGETADQQRGVDRKSQYHPLAVQWRASCGHISTLRISDTPEADVMIQQDVARVSWQGHVTFALHDPCPDTLKISNTLWIAGNMRIQVQTDARKVGHTGDQKDVVIRYDVGHFSRLVFTLAQ
ncbi:hypothetical protein [Gluconobacter sp. P5E10]|uniref:hypothetical protein n=1 Tax=Gluconobacter sp. P5E10 TaxID=2762613 RepID=UPI001C05D4E1|nr:hypothetical protein [Gluconobacter sp. P5E10]